jgi:hypothetical protein
MRTLLVVLLALSGCKKDDPDDDTGVPDPNTVPHNGETTPARDADATYDGDLATGVLIEDLSFAENAYCFPGNEFNNFSGNHVFFDIPQPQAKNIIIRVTPEKHLDVSIYALQTDPDTTAVPPDVGSSYSCEASFDAPNDNNPGTSEAVQMLGWYEYRIVLGVVGANGVTEGLFTIETWEEQGSDPQE